MKTFTFRGCEVVASKVVAIGPVVEDAELGKPAFAVFLDGGHELYFCLPDDNDQKYRVNRTDGLRDAFIGLLNQTL